MVAHIYKTKKIFVKNRIFLIREYKYYVIRLIMNRSYFDADDYQTMREVQQKLFPLTFDEEMDIMNDIKHNMRIFSSEDF